MSSKFNEWRWTSLFIWQASAASPELSHYSSVLSWCCLFMTHLECQGVSTPTIPSHSHTRHRHRHRHTHTHTHTHTARWQTELCVRLWGRLGVLRDGKVLSLGGTGKLGISVIEVLMVKEPKIGCVLSLWSHVPSYCLIDISLKRKWNTRCSNQNLHDISQLDNS